MGRGRAKAKQTKVARDLKYNSQEMDLDRLAKELHGDVPNQQNQDDDDPFAEGNYQHRMSHLCESTNHFLHLNPSTEFVGRISMLR
jgi:hypothetical protein